MMLIDTGIYHTVLVTLLITLRCRDEAKCSSRKVLSWHRGIEQLTSLVNVVESRACVYHTPPWVSKTVCFPAVYRS